MKILEWGNVGAVAKLAKASSSTHFRLSLSNKLIYQFRHKLLDISSCNLIDKLSEWFIYYVKGEWADVSIGSLCVKIKIYTYISYIFKGIFHT